MADSNSISPTAAAIMADAVYALKDSDLATARAARTDFSGEGAASDAGVISAKGKSGLLGHSSNFGYCATGSAGSKFDGHAFIVTKGTSPCLEDVQTDLNAVPWNSYGKLAAMGFVNTFKSLESAVDDFLPSDCQTVHCIGHSLGGALATLMAHKYSKLGKAVKLYTFGSPRVFFHGSSSLPGIDSYRVYHPGDIVPMLAPYPMMHHDDGIRVGSAGAWIITPQKHVMSSYSSLVDGESWSGLRGPEPADVMSFSDQAASYVGKTAGMLWRFLQHLVSLALAVIGGVVVAALTVVDLIYRLVTEGIPRLGRMALTLLRGMGRFINDGWESTKATTSDTYYQSKRAIYYILERFLVKMRQYYAAAMSAARYTIGAGGDAARRIAPIVGVPGIMFF